MSFGAVASVWHYVCINQEVCQFIRESFGLPQIAYVDDCCRVCPHTFAMQGGIVFRGVRGMIGFPFKTCNEDVGDVLEIVGREVAEITKWVCMWVAEGRKKNC